MPVTLAQATQNATDDVDLAVINEFHTNSLLDLITLDDVVHPGGGGATLTYGYCRQITQATAAFRAINGEWTGFVFRLAPGCHPARRRSVHPHLADVVHAPYRREPYIRVTWHDGKALASTRERVLFHAAPDGVVTEEWVPAAAATRIRREESAWIDPYDQLQ